VFPGYLGRNRLGVFRRKDKRLEAGQHQDAEAEEKKQFFHDHSFSIGIAF